MAQDIEFLMLRGLARESGHWGEFTEHMAESLEAKLICTDLPGSGRYVGIPAPLSIPKMVKFLRSQIPQTKNKRIIMGESLGGMVATEWARLYPEEAAGGVILINTSYARRSIPLKRMMPSALAKFYRASQQKDHHEREKFIHSVIANITGSDDSRIQQWAQIAKDRPVSDLNVLRQLVAALSYLGPSEPLKVPTLVISSIKDKLAHASCSKKVAKVLKADIEYHDTAGHDITGDDAEWTIKIIRKWMEKHKYR